MKALSRRLGRRFQHLRRRREEAGYVAVVVAMLFATVFIGMAAIGVDTARWYQEAEKVQKAADAAALAGVTYMPNDLTKARTTAIAVATKNGYPNSGRTKVVVEVGSRPSELKVTITSKVDNFFGAAFGVKADWISRAATADFTAPAPMGSPCNTFGNEPPSSPGAAQPVTTALPSTPFAACPKDANGYSTPNYWSGIEGPETDKLQGDRHQAKACAMVGNTGGATWGCASGSSSEYIPAGYYYVVHVEPAAVGTPIDVQVYDPQFTYTGSGVTCSALPVSTSLVANMNPYATTDGNVRYARFGGTGGIAAAKKFCPGDLYPGNGDTTRPTTTTFVMRNRTDTNNPALATPLTACPAKQFRGFSTTPTATMLQSSHNDYNPQFASVFHAWYSLCTFTPTGAGDYYLQVRTNVALGGPGSTFTPNVNPNGLTKSPVVYTNPTAAYAPVGDSTQGHGANSFSLRAVPSAADKRDDVAVSGWERMPLLQIDENSTAVFNLVRALPNSKGQFLTFSFFDASDGASGTVKVLPPLDATGSVTGGSGVPGCKAGKNNIAPGSYTALTGCSVAVTGSQTDGQVMHMVIPIPNDYSCNNSTLGGCWFRVQMAYNGPVTDFTTWSANIGGDPVRLVR
jgi:Flp pilus assembly protein TadG